MSYEFVMKTYDEIQKETDKIIEELKSKSNMDVRTERTAYTVVNRALATLNELYVVNDEHDELISKVDNNVLNAVVNMAEDICRNVIDSANINYYETVHRGIIKVLDKWEKDYLEKDKGQER